MLCSSYDQHRLWWWPYRQKKRKEDLAGPGCLFRLFHNTAPAPAPPLPLWFRRDIRHLLYTKLKIKINKQNKKVCTKNKRKEHGVDGWKSCNHQSEGSHIPPFFLSNDRQRLAGRVVDDDFCLCSTRYVQYYEVYTHLGPSWHGIYIY